MPKQKKENITWYQEASDFGRRYVDLTIPENFAKLTSEEKIYLSYQQRVYKYDIEATTEAVQKGIFAKAHARDLYKILTGELFRKSLDTFGENYATAINYNLGDTSVGDLFQRIWKRMDYSERYNFATFDLPEIPIFYKLKMKAEGRTNQALSLAIENAIEIISSEVIKQAFRKNIRFNYNKFKEAILYATGYTIEDIREIAKEEGISIKSIIWQNLYA